MPDLEGKQFLGLVLTQEPTSLPAPPAGGTWDLKVEVDEAWGETYVSCETTSTWAKAPLREEVYQTPENERGLMTKKADEIAPLMPLEELSSSHKRFSWECQLQVGEPYEFQLFEFRKPEAGSRLW